MRFLLLLVLLVTACDQATAPSWCPRTYDVPIVFIYDSLVGYDIYTGPILVQVHDTLDVKAVVTETCDGKIAVKMPMPDTITP